MSKHPLPLSPNSVPCVGSGFCCKKRPCAFGEVTAPDNLSCKFLEPISVPDGHTQRYTCGKYDEIVEQPGWDVNPAFGAGCCSPLFNEDRRKILQEMHEDNNANDTTE